MITVIIPSLCDSKRAESLVRAIESIKSASARPVRIVVVVNGQRYDPELLAHIRARPDVEVLQLREGSQVLAQRAGRAVVNTEFFSFLDDDDEYLPGALDQRVQLIEASGADVAVTNGFRVSNGVNAPLYARMAYVAPNPMAELFFQNWLCDCNHLFRTATIDQQYFENTPPLMEWTWIAFRLAHEGKKIASSDTMGFLCHDTPGSLSKTSEFFSCRVSLYERMLSLRPERAAGRMIKKKLTAAWHDIATAEHEAGNTSSSFRAHLRSMSAHWSGLKYLPFTRHLVVRRFTHKAAA
jgi:glycosyltransferase involved in cell wall biosynthesis